MTANDLSADDQRVGRYSHAELSSMRGRRGRKPPEFYQLFPELKKAEATPKARAQQEATEQAPDPDGLAQRLRTASPAVRRLVEALLALPELANTSLGKSTELSLRIPVAAMAADEALTIAEPQAASVDEQVLVLGTESAEGITTLPFRDPVYADPESEPVLGAG